MPRVLIIAFVVLSLLHGSCSARRPAAAPPPTITEDAKPTATPPAVEPARQYGQVREAVLSEDEQALWDELERRRLDGVRCRLDGTLCGAARRHAADVLNRPGMPAEEGMDYLRFALRVEGGTDYSISPVMFIPDDRGIDELVRILASSPAATHCGIGVARQDGKSRAVFIGTNRLLRVDPFTVSPSVGASVTISGELAHHLTEPPAGFLEHPDGTVRVLKIYPVGRRFNLRVAFPGAGRYVLELQVTDENGPETQVLVPIFVGMPIAARPTIFPQVDGADPDPKGALTALINRLRSAAGLHPLTRDSRLDKVAQSHCQDMVATGYFGHFSVGSGLVHDRLRSQGLTPSAVGENIARSTSILRVHHNLMESPSHKIKLLHPDYTHLGLGVAKDGDSVVVTQVFARW